MSLAKTGRFHLAFILLAILALVPGAFATDPAKTQPPQASAALPDSSGPICCNRHLQNLPPRDLGKAFLSYSAFCSAQGNEHGCQACHGPGQAHVDGGGDVTKIIRFETLSPAQTAAICTKCHQSSLETQNFSKSEHLSNGVSCTTCHSPHKSTDVNFMLVKSQTELCFGCHAAQKAEFARPYRHRVDSGLIQCSDCHNPHGTERTSGTRGCRPVRGMHQVPYRYHGAVRLRACPGQDGRGLPLLPHASRLDQSAVVAGE